MQYRLQTQVFFFLLMVLQGCSSTFEDQQPEESTAIQPGDTVVVHLPENRTVKSGRTFSDLTESEGGATGTDVKVTSFPRAGRRVQDALVSILEQNEEDLGFLESGSTGIRIPYRFSPEQSDLNLDVQKTDRVVNLEQLDPEVMESSADVVISGRMDGGFAGMGKAIEEMTNKRVPDRHALFHLETLWRVTLPSKGTSKTFRISDDALVDFSIHPDPVKRFYQFKKTFQELLRRVAWRVASRLVPHQYDTSFGKEEK